MAASSAALTSKFTSIQNLLRCHAAAAAAATTTTMSAFASAATSADAARDKSVLDVPRLFNEPGAKSPVVGSPSRDMMVFGRINWLSIGSLRISSSITNGSLLAEARGGRRKILDNDEYDDDDGDFDNDDDDDDYFDDDFGNDTDDFDDDKDEYESDEDKIFNRKK
ncbi:hypothetical protein Nepgr_026796 [Nepenthes gracilis]|uniref:Uncharacterized protein n=1 Tax=Nepenthes gracilis TaxID=150966 RepID=A0AAD3T981_NEPGR|nr:hypothetical protein Nepgr_026796 [Nepenthes gracilis]